MSILVFREFRRTTLRKLLFGLEIDTRNPRFITSHDFGKLVVRRIVVVESCEETIFSHFCIETFHEIRT